MCASHAGPTVTSMKTVERVYAPRQALALMRQGAPALLARLWAGRGIDTVDQVVHPVARLLPYTDLLNCEAAAHRLASAIKTEQRILVVADYDADGATACSVMVRGLRAYGANVGFLIPNRLEHGYGLTPEIVEVAADLSPRPEIILTVDNGISSHAGIARANELGLEVVVTDHHLAAATLPAASVIVNPNQPACQFASKAMAGCGVAWYVMWALQDALFEHDIAQADPSFSVHDLLPIVAIGTVADVVALDANNRSLVAEGLARIRSGKSFAGIDALAKAASRDPRELSTTDIAFGVGPQINAAGRLESMDAGVDCLTTDDKERARVLAGLLHDINQRRKEIEADTVEEATRQLFEKVDVANHSIVLHSTQWHQGVIGIVAGRIKEKYFRPTFVLANGNEGEVKGSGRSIPGFHLRDALDLVDKRVPGVLLKFGGHAMAAGVTIRADSVDAFRAAFEEVARSLLTPDQLNQELIVDGGLEPGELSLETVRLLKQQVWGQAFPEPIFFDTFEVVDARPIGEGKHLKLSLARSGKRYGAVRFRYSGPLPTGRLKVAYKVDANTFRDETNLQLLVEHFQQA